MRKIFVFNILLINFLSFSQDFKIPKISFEANSNNSKDYVEMFGLKDNNALFIKVGYSIYGVNPSFENDFIVFLNNGKIKKYHVVLGELKNDVKKIRVKKNDYRLYWTFLNNCVNNNRFKLEKSKLHATWIPQDEDSPTRKVISVSDGGALLLEVSQNGQNISYGSENPDTYIQAKVYGYSERQKFLDLILDFQKLFSSK